jgi:hypothetical protein
MFENINAENKGHCCNSNTSSSRPLLLVLEGQNDYEFLRRMSARVHEENREIPSLAHAIEQGSIIIAPVGGGDPATWPDRFAALGLQEFHLLCSAPHNKCYVV